MISSSTLPTILPRGTYVNMLADALHKTLSRHHYGRHYALEIARLVHPFVARTDNLFASYGINTLTGFGDIVWNQKQSVLMGIDNTGTQLSAISFISVDGKPYTGSVYVNQRSDAIRYNFFAGRLGRGCAGRLCRGCAGRLCRGCAGRRLLPTYVCGPKFALKPLEFHSIGPESAPVPCIANMREAIGIGLESICSGPCTKNHFLYFEGYDEIIGEDENGASIGRSGRQPDEFMARYLRNNPEFDIVKVCDAIIANYKIPRA